MFPRPLQTPTDSPRPDGSEACNPGPHADEVDIVRPVSAGPSFQGDEISPGRDEQLPLDLIDEESMESFPCSDPPSYSTCHA